jgi:hypothetical protein
MHHYKMAEEAVAKAVEGAGGAGWGEEEILQSLIVVAIARHAGLKGGANTKAMLAFEMSNLSDTVDYDFVRSR